MKACCWQPQLLTVCGACHSLRRELLVQGVVLLVIILVVISVLDDLLFPLALARCGAGLTSGGGTCSRLHRRGIVGPQGALHPRLHDLQELPQLRIVLCIRRRTQLCERGALLVHSLIGAIVMHAERDMDYKSKSCPCRKYAYNCPMAPAGKRSTR